MPTGYTGGETDSAVEKLLLRKNGDPKTVTDVFEVLVAMHHDSQHRDRRIEGMIHEHLREIVHMKPDEFDKMVESFTKRHEARDSVVASMQTTIHLLEADIAVLKEHCNEIREIEGIYEDDEIGDIRRIWRVAKWVLGIAALPLIVALGNLISNAL